MTFDLGSMNFQGKKLFAHQPIDMPLLKLTGNKSAVQ
jgi:hypothetical protein